MNVDVRPSRVAAVTSLGFVAGLIFHVGVGVDLIPAGAIGWLVAWVLTSPALHTGRHPEAEEAQP